MANTKITPHVLDSTLISGHSTVTAATNDFVLIQDVSDSNALKKALVSDLAQNEESPTFTGNVTVDGTLAAAETTITTTGTSTALQLISTDAGASASPILDLYRNSSSAADGDVLGLIKFTGNSGGSGAHTYGQIRMENNGVTDGQEQGKFIFDISMPDGDLANAFHIGRTEITVNEDSEDLNFRVESNDHTHMLFVDGGTNRVGINNPSSATAPVFPFVVWDDDEVTILGHGNNATYIQRYQTHATAPATLVIDKARGTQASPTTVSPGDDLGRILMRGYTNNGYYEAASIHAEANTSNLVNDGADIPSDLYFKTTRDGGSGPLERLRIDYDGGIWHRNGQYGRYQWTKGVAFSAGQTQNLKFHLNGSNVFGQVRVTITGDYGNVNANGTLERVWGWGYNSSNTSNYGGGGSGTQTVAEGSTSNVLSFGSMDKINNTTVKIPITNGNGSYSLNVHIHVEITGDLAGLGYTSIS